MCEKHLITCEMYVIFSKGGNVSSRNILCIALYLVIDYPNLFTLQKEYTHSKNTTIFTSEILVKAAPAEA